MRSTPLTARSTGLVAVRSRVVVALVLMVGLVSMTLVQLHGHVIPAPLLDGLLIIEPYRYLDPVGDARGNPTSVDRSRKVPRPNGLVSVSTREVPPQAQVFALGKKIAFPAGAKRYRATIEPQRSAVAPDTGYLVGNPYRIELRAQGSQLRVREGKRVTVALRAPAGVSDAHIAMLEDGAWVPLRTFESGLPDVYLADVDTLGTFAIISDHPDPGCHGYYLPGFLQPDALLVSGDEPTPVPTAGPSPGASGSPCPPLMSDDPSHLLTGGDGAIPTIVPPVPSASIASPVPSASIAASMSPTAAPSESAGPVEPAGADSATGEAAGSGLDVGLLAIAIAGLLGLAAVPLVLVAVTSARERRPPRRR